MTALYRLTQEAINDPVFGSVTDSYTYDAVGDRTSSTENGVATAYTYDANDRLLTAGSKTYTYDSNGNRLSTSFDTTVKSYSYDENNRLVQMTTQTGGVTTDTVDYVYDADGIRLAKDVNGVRTNFLVDEDRNYAQVLEALDGSNAVTASYVRGNSLISLKNATGTHYYHSDGHGNIRALSDATGAITDTYTYNAYGEDLASTGTTKNVYKFAGEQEDPESGTYYLRARYYDPTAGGFISRDSFGGIETRPLSLNKYLYTEGDPINGIDPSGHITLGGLLVSEANEEILDSIAVPTFRVFLKKTGCVAIDYVAQEGINSLIDYGIYVFMDSNTGKKYVGKTGRNYAARLREHEKEEKRAVDQVLKKFKVDQEVRDAFGKNFDKFLSKLEQLVIDRNGGLSSGDLSNARNELNAAKRKLLRSLDELCAP